MKKVIFTPQEPSTIQVSECENKSNLIYAAILYGNKCILTKDFIKDYYTWLILGDSTTNGNGYDYNSKLTFEEALQWIYTEQGELYQLSNPKELGEWLVKD